MASNIDIRTRGPAEITVTAVRRQSVDMEVSGGASGEPYEGPYEVTPSSETQVLRTQQKMAIRNIIVNPIPSNYGLITWNGSVLTVS